MISPEVLRRFPIFAGLDHEVLVSIAMHGQDVTVEPGQWLFRQDEAARWLYVVVSGGVDLAVHLNGVTLQDGRVDSRIAGELIGWSALVPPHRYTLGAVTRLPTRLVRIDGQQLRTILDADPAAGYRFMDNVAQVMGERLNSLRVRLASLTPA